MKIKFTIPCLALIVLMTTTNHGRADQAPQNGKTSAAQIKKESEAFWITEKTQAVKTPPTMANVPYGEHQKQVLDFWQAKSEKPAPLVLFIHGGSWRTHDKENRRSCFWTQISPKI